MDYVGICLDEIALEGLDGITLSALWLRLENLQPALPLSLDDHTKEFLWKNVLTNDDSLQLFELPEARPDLVIMRRFDFMDPETGICVEQPVGVDIYPVKMIHDVEKGIIGSCTTYFTRTEVTNLVRDADGKLLFSLQQALDRWGSALVIVASQERRNRVLYGLYVDNDLQLPMKQYCYLERIGRSRYEGEVTFGANSLVVFRGLIKCQFYIRKLLLRRDVITIQIFNQRMLRGANQLGKLVHLKRFFVLRKPTYLGWLESLTHMLDERPQKRDLATTLRHQLGLQEKTFKKLVFLGNRYVKRQIVPYRNFYPNATSDQYLCKNQTERNVRVLTLEKVFTYSINCTLDEDEATAADNDEADNDDADNDDADLDSTLDMPLANPVTLPSRKRVIELPVMQQAYAYVLEQRQQGITQRMLSEAFRVGRLQSRQLCRNLLRLGVVVKILHDQGKQRIQRYIANEFAGTSVFHKRFEQEKTKILNLTRSQRSTHSKKDDTSFLEAISSRNKDAKPSTTDESTVDEMEPKEEEEDVTNDDVEETPLHGKNDGKALFVHIKKKSAHLTYRMLKRANIIIEAVKELKLIDVFIIQKKIIDQETAEGHNYRLDKKSLIRLVGRLAKEGQVKSIKTTLHMEGEKKPIDLHFLCEPHMSADDDLVKSAILSAKQKHMGLSKKDTPALPKEGDAHQAKKMMKSLTKEEKKALNMVYDSTAGKRYGYQPRMKRYQQVHHLLWYLVYGYGETMDANTDNQIISGIDVYESAEPSEDAHYGQFPIDEQVSKIYLDDSSWRSFLPPLPPHAGYPEGWCLIGDVLYILPVCIFCQLMSVNFKIRGLLETLRDPVRRNLPVTQLPVEMRQQLLFDRKYIHQFCELCNGVSQMGLLSFGKREWKEKDQLFIYLHKNISLIDTSVMPVCDRPRMHFHLDTHKELQNYWFTLQCTCYNTPYDTIKCPTKCRRLTKVLAQDSSLVLSGKSVSEIVDDGFLPGDNLGAGGLDSGYWGHLRRNWNFKDTDLKMDVLKKGRTCRKRKHSLSSSSPPPKNMAHDTSTEAATKQTANDSLSIKKGNLSKAKRSKKIAGTPVENVKTVMVKASEQKKGGKGLKRKRKENCTASLAAIPAKKKKKLKVLLVSREYDDVDREALRRMVKERVEWTAEEDSLLLLCQVASRFLIGSRRDMLVNWCVIRDILHENFESSLDKTSKACQRRVAYVMRNAVTRTNVHGYVGEALQDEALLHEFKKDKKYVKTEFERNRVLFRSLLLKLKDKFKKSLPETMTQLPSTLAEVYAKYHVGKEMQSTETVHKDVTTDKDVYASVLHNLIHSAMLLNDKTGRAHELFKLFSQYPDDLLHEVFTSMRNDGIITKIKKHEKRKFQWNTIPCVSLGNYQVAQRYMYRWYSRYPKAIFEGCWQVAKRLTSPTNASLDLEEHGSFAALVVTLLVNNQITMELGIPEQMIETIDSQETRVMQRQEELTLSDEEEEALIDEAVTEQDAENKDKGEKPSASRILLAVMQRGNRFISSTKGQSNTYDSIKMNSCHVKVSLKPDVDSEQCDTDVKCLNAISAWNRTHLWLHRRTCFCILRCLRCLQPRHVTPVAAVLAENDDDDGLDAALLAEVFQTIHNDAGTLGITHYDLQHRFQDEEKLNRVLCILEDNFLILKVGVTRIRYVSHQHSRPWLIYSMKNVKGRGRVTSDTDEADDVMEMPFRLSLPGYSKEKAAEPSSCMTSENTAVRGKSHEETAQDVINTADTVNEMMTSSKPLISPTKPSCILDESHPPEVIQSPDLEGQPLPPSTPALTPDHTPSDSTTYGPRTPARQDDVLVRSPPPVQRVVYLHHMPTAAMTDTPVEEMDVDPLMLDSAELMRITEQRSNVCSLKRTETLPACSQQAEMPPRPVSSVQSLDARRLAEIPVNVRAAFTKAALQAPNAEVQDGVGQAECSTTAACRVERATRQLFNAQAQSTECDEETNPVQQSSIVTSRADKHSTHVDTEHVTSVRAKCEVESEMKNKSSLTTQPKGDGVCAEDKQLSTDKPDCRGTGHMSDLGCEQQLTASAERTKSATRKSTYTSGSTIPPATGTYQRVRLVPRPWKTLNGTVNRPSLKMMLEAVMMFIMTKPGVTFNDLCAKYNPMLQPIPLFELLELLEQLGCVSHCIIKSDIRPSLFSKRRTLSSVTTDRGSETVTYLPTPECILKLGQFEGQLSSGQRSS